MCSCRKHEYWQLGSWWISIDFRKDFNYCTVFLWAQIFWPRRSQNQTLNKFADDQFFLQCPITQKSPRDRACFSSQKDTSVNIFLCFYSRLIQYALLPEGNDQSRAELNSTVDRKSIEKLRIRSAHIFTVENSYQNQRFVVR